MEIADAVLTLSTDDRPLRDGLNEAESRVRAAMERMQDAFRTVASFAGADGSASEEAAEATAILFGLTQVLVGIAPAGLAAGNGLAVLSASADDLGLTTLTAAGRISTATTLISEAAERLLALVQAASAAPGGASDNEAFDALASDESTAVGADPATGRPFTARRAPAASRRQGRSNTPIVGALNITVERENPRAIQLGVERAMQELATRADLAGAID
jgi:hypothetical protein